MAHKPPNLDDVILNSLAYGGNLCWLQLQTGLPEMVETRGWVVLEIDPEDREAFGLSHIGNDHRHYLILVPETEGNVIDQVCGYHRFDEVKQLDRTSIPQTVIDRATMVDDEYLGTLANELDLIGPDEVIALVEFSDDDYGLLMSTVRASMDTHNFAEIPTTFDREPIPYLPKQDRILLLRGKSVVVDGILTVLSEHSIACRTMDTNTAWRHGLLGILFHVEPVIDQSNQVAAAA